MSTSGHCAGLLLDTCTFLWMVRTPGDLSAPAREERQRHGILPLALEEEALRHLPKLPDHHRDPFDRMLICQAIEGGLVLVTPDPEIHRYPVRLLW
ncbi:MAG: type II toxin-antitoxin system VapC family toxin [Cyanobacteriota bacterium]